MSAGFAGVLALQGVWLGGVVARTATRRGGAPVRKRVSLDDATRRHARDDDVLLAFSVVV